jgi:hypothetical protein
VGVTHITVRRTECVNLLQHSNFAVIHNKVCKLRIHELNMSVVSVVSLIVMIIRLRLMNLISCTDLDA